MEVIGLNSQRRKVGREVGGTETGMRMGSEGGVEQMKVRGVKEDWCGNGDSIMESTMDSVRDKDDDMPAGSGVGGE